MLKERSNIYGLLSRVYFSEPTEELLGLLAKSGFEYKEQHEDLAVEYTRLFIGPGKHIPPYESVQRPNDKGRLWGESTVIVKKFIESTGLKYKSNFSGMPDHISAEFEFMQKLIDKEAEAEDRGDVKAAKRSQEIQKKFFEEHIARWVPLFCQRVKEEPNVQFYKDMADLTRDFIFQEKEEFENV